MEPGRNSGQGAGRGGGFAALFAAGRLVGFMLFVLPAIAALAALVLVPAYADMLQSRYLLERQRAELGDLAAAIKAHERLIADLPDSEVQTKRLMLCQTPLVPANELVCETPISDSLSPGSISFVPHPRPAPPEQRILRLAEKLQDKATRRGIFVVAMGAIVAAMFLFSPPERYRRNAAPPR